MIIVAKRSYSFYTDSVENKNRTGWIFSRDRLAGRKKKMKERNLLKKYQIEMKDQFC